MPKRTDIKSILIIGAASVAACTTHPPADQPSLDQMAMSCSLPKGSAIYHAGQAVELKLSPDANYDDVSCFLEKLKVAGVKRLGFVGNEQLGMGQHK